MRALDALHRDLPPVTRAGRLDAGIVVIPIAASALYLTAAHHARPIHFRNLVDPAALGGTAPHLGWFLSTLVLYLLVPLLVLRLLGEPLKEYGLGPGRARLGAAIAGVLAAVMVPVALVASRFPVFAGHYPLSPGATTSWSILVLYEAAYALYFVGWEGLWRSFLLFGLYRRIGLAAVYVSVLPFAIAHQLKPEAEGYGSIVAGIALGYLALRTRSFWWGALLHAAIAVTMDLAAAQGRLPRL
jgi:hypothetical protein